MVSYFLTCAHVCNLQHTRRCVYSVQTFGGIFVVEGQYGVHETPGSCSHPVHDLASMGIELWRVEG
jgi:hypothetical protein